VRPELLPALARERVAIMSRVAEMISACIARVALTGFQGHVALPAVRKALELDRRGGLLGQRAEENAGQSNNQFSHRSPRGLLRRIDTATDTSVQV
jgi:hypothetical protein